MISLYINYNIVICLDPCTFAKNMFAEVLQRPKTPSHSVIPMKKPLGCVEFPMVGLLALICLVFGIFFSGFEGPMG